MPIVLKSGSLNLLDPSGPVQASNTPYNQGVRYVTFSLVSENDNILVATYRGVSCLLSRMTWTISLYCDNEQNYERRSQWPRGLRSTSAAARLLRLWVRIPPAAWISVCCECCVLSVRGLCDELITRPEESYRLWCVAVCDLETSRMRRPWPALGRSATNKKLRI